LIKMLVTVDESEHSRKVIDEAIQLASCLGAEVTLLTVMEDVVRLGGVSEVPMGDIQRLNESRKNSLEQYLKKEAEKFKEKGTDVKVKLATGTHPGQTICDIAKEEDHSYIVLGSRGISGIARIFLGSVSNWVAQNAEQNVVIIK